MKFEVAGDETQAAALGLNASVDMENRYGMYMINFKMLPSVMISMRTSCSKSYFAGI